MVVTFAGPEALLWQRDNTLTVAFLVGVGQGRCQRISFEFIIQIGKEKNSISKIINFILVFY